MIRKRRFLLLVLALLLASAASAQRRLTFRIAGFELAEEDLTARNEKYQLKDNDGNLCAIVKVRTDNPQDTPQDYKFDFGTYIDVKRTEMHDDALWIWVQQEAKKVSVRREGYAAISQHSLGLTIQKGRTYDMLLSAQMPEVRYRIVQFQVTPAHEGAIVKVKREDSDGDYELWGTVDATGGKAQRLETGVVYRYEVLAPHYDKAEGRIVLSYSDDNHVEQVALRPNFGYLEVVDEQGIAGAEVYVNDRRIGVVPCKEQMDVGENYRITVAKELYKNYNATFVIRNGETTRLAPRLELDYAETTIVVPDNAEIILDGISRARGKWTGTLKAGTYNVECRLDELHRPTRRQILVRPGISETFTMDAPAPITGSIYVTSNPLGATVLLDGKDIGQTPKEVKNILIGNHSLTLSLARYKNENRRIEVEENKTMELEVVLAEKKPGKEKKEVKETKVVKEKVQRTEAKHAKVYQKPSSLYLTAGAQVGHLMAVGATVGAYIKHFNIEASYLYGIGSGQEVYWYGVLYQNYVKIGYSPMAYGGRVGYGFDILKKKQLRLTPQVGTMFVDVRGHEEGETSHCYAITLPVGLCADYAFNKHLGIFLAPEMSIAVKKSDIYSPLSEVSPKIKHWASGFNVRIGIRYSF